MEQESPLEGNEISRFNQKLLLEKQFGNRKHENEQFFLELHYLVVSKLSLYIN
jgi:hypothetical protein